MKYLIMTEGSCEKALLDVFIEKDLLKYERNDLLYEEIHHARQIKGQLITKIEQLPPSEKIVIIRVGDKLNDELKIPKHIKYKINDIIKICIKPEFELLHIINEGEYKKYNNNKHIKPCEYLLKYVLKDYEKHYEYNYNYFMLLEVAKIRNIINDYNRLRHDVHDKNEYTISYLLK